MFRHFQIFYRHKEKLEKYLIKLLGIIYIKGGVTKVIS